MSIEATCLHCAKAIVLPKGEYPRANRPRHFCGRGCMTAWRQAKAEAEAPKCQICQRPVVSSRKGRGVRKRKHGMFCSMACRNQWMASGAMVRLEPKVCPSCKASFQPKCRTQTFCSMECRNAAHMVLMKQVNPNFKDGSWVHYYSRRFKQVISPQLIAKIGACMACGSTEALVVHHMNEDKTDNTPENLAVVCRSCHMKLHKLKNAEKKNALTARLRESIASSLVAS